MAKETCVFCGQEVSDFVVKQVFCGPVLQYACKSCAKEVNELDGAERCRRALQRGLAVNAERIQEHLDIMEHAEEARPTCLRCGEKLRFGEMQELDNSPYRDGLLTSTFDVLPAYCTNCGKMELYSPQYISKHKMLSYLVKIDTGVIK